MTSHLGSKPSPRTTRPSPWALHELSYRGFAEVDERWEQDPVCFGVRTRLESELETELRDRWPGPPVEIDLAGGFFDWVAEQDGPSLAKHVQNRATREQVAELLCMRSLYHLKEADPTTWVIPRLSTAAKAALAELQYDEYGVGDPSRLHAHLWARGLESNGLSAEYGDYVDQTPTEVLVQNNALSLFGLQRRLRGAAVGHLAAFEATSSLPSKQMARGLQLLGFSPEMMGYYTEHVEADAVHEQVALRDVCVVMVREEPQLLDDVWFGAWACLDLEARAAVSLLRGWGEAA